MPELPTLKAVNSSAWVKAAGSTRNDFMAPGNSHDLIPQFHMRRGNGQRSKLIWKSLNYSQSSFPWDISSGDGYYDHSWKKKSLRRAERWAEQQTNILIQSLDPISAQLENQEKCFHFCQETKQHIFINEREINGKQRASWNISTKKDAVTLTVNDPLDNNVIYCVL